MMTDIVAVRVFLESAIEAKMEIRRHQERVAELESRCMKMTAGSNGMPGGGEKDAQYLWSTLADERTKALEAEKRETLAYKRVESFISEIPDKHHRIILRLRYLQGLGWIQVQMHLYDAGIFYSERHIYRLHEEALESAAELWSRRNGGDGDGVPA